MGKLREDIQMSLRQIQVSEDPDGLQAWIRSKTDSWQWALWQLSKVNAELYLDELECMFSSADRSEIFPVWNWLQRFCGFRLPGPAMVK